MVGRSPDAPSRFIVSGRSGCGDSNTRSPHPGVSGSAYGTPRNCPTPLGSRFPISFTSPPGSVSTAVGGAGSAVDGSLVLWDITDPTNPAQVWHYPESGTVGMPHSPVMKRVSGTWVLAYAHTIGMSDAGNEVHSSVGLAISDDLTAQPTYVADGVLPTALGDIETSRGVELGTDGRLYVVETGSRGGDGRLLTATLPELTPAGSSGAYSESHADQIFVTLDDAAVLADDLGGAFEPRLWTPSY